MSLKQRNYERMSRDVQHLWTPRGTIPELCDGEAHVWSASLAVSRFELEQMRAVLSSDELLRSERSPLIEERNRFTVGRGLLRQVLAPYLNVEADELQFTYGHAGKPYLVNNPHNIHFNISHSGDIALVAVTRAREIGVDVEKISDMPEMDDIVSRFFSDGAKAEFQSAPVADRLEVFFKCWTEREAISKCTGDGIADEKPLSVQGITVIPLSPAMGYVGALAINGPAVKVRTWRWAQSGNAVGTEPFAVAVTGAFL
jgi:4'-phosphopantetheinyl transferase